MQLLVTGTSGLIGSRVAQQALERGHRVRALDRNPARPELRALRARYDAAQLEWVYADLTDRLALLRAAEGCDAILHLAAIPSPNPAVNDRLLHINVVGTGYIFDAAEAHAIKRVALASSASIYGLPFAKHPFDPQYLPMDEAHPVQPQDIYALSKLCNEEMAATYTRRLGIATFCLRPTYVADLGGERASWQRRWISRAGENRSPDLWTYVAVEDCARAFLLAAESPTEGHHRLLLAARDSWLRGDMREAVRRHYPSLAGFLEGVGPHDSLYDTSRAHDILGWQAERSWRDVPELAEDTEWKPSSMSA